MAWRSIFTERELKEIQFCKVYQSDFAHGTDGHNIRLIIAKMADLLDGNLLVTEVINPDAPKPSGPIRKPAAIKD